MADKTLKLIVEALEIIQTCFNNSLRGKEEWNYSDLHELEIRINELKARSERT